MSRTSQRDRVLHRLEKGPATMWQLTVDLGILRPGARIFELRQQGYEITSTEQMLSGKRVVTYRLEGRGDSQKQDAPTGTDGNGSNGHISGVCLECEKLFRTKKRTKRFCSDACRTAHWKRENPPTGFLFGNEATA